jgi:hypothetical protein
MYLTRLLSVPTGFFDRRDQAQIRPSAETLVRADTFAQLRAGGLSHAGAVTFKCRGHLLVVCALGGLPES